MISDLEFIEGLFALIPSVVSAFIGVLFILQSKKYEKNRTLYRYTGIFWAFLGSTHWSASISFILYVSSGNILPDFLYLFIIEVAFPIALLTWYYVWSLLMEFSKKKILAFNGIIVTIFYILLIVLMFNPDTIYLVGEKENKFNIQMGIFSLIFALYAFVSILITGSIFAKKSMDLAQLYNKKTYKWRGLFVMAGFSVWIVGVLGDAFIPTSVLPATISVMTVLTRTLIIISGIFFYLAFFKKRKG